MILTVFLSVAVAVFAAVLGTIILAVAREEDRLPTEEEGA